MRKNILFLLSVFAVAITLFSCEEEEETPDIKLVPVYRITDTGNAEMATITIYKESDLLTVWNTSDKVTAFRTTDFSQVADTNRVLVDSLFIGEGEALDTLTLDYQWTEDVSVKALEDIVEMGEDEVNKTITLTHAYTVADSKKVYSNADTMVVRADFSVKIVTINGSDTTKTVVLSGKGMNTEVYN